MNTPYLLVPLLLPLLGAALSALLSVKAVRHRALIAVMSLECVFTFLAHYIGGALRLPLFAGLDFVLVNDDLSKFFSLLFVLMFLAAGVFGFEYLHEREQSYYVYYLLTLTSLVGLCYAGNLFTFYLFYEFMTILSFPLVLHERTEASRTAAFRYLGYSLFGAALALFGFFVVGQLAPSTSFVPGGVFAAGTESRGLLLLAALAMLVGFGGKAGLMPLHDWLPTAHPQAPAPASAVLSGVITKGGVLGILRVAYYLFGASFLRGTYVQYTMLVLSLVTVFCGSMLAYKEKILKKRLAYSTVSQVSYVVFGLMLFCGAGFTGALLQAVFHAVSKVCLFLCAGAVICKTGKTKVSELYGIGRQMPLMLFCFALAGLSLIGIPPFAGFVSKWYLATGSLAEFPACGWIGAAVLLVSALLTAGYLLSPVSKGFFPGEEYEPDAKVTCGLCITLPLVCLAAALLVMGLFPAPFIHFISRIAGTLV